MTQVLKAKPINQTDSNYDSDQSILANTVKTDGKWRFYDQGILLAEADAPTDPSREVLEQWCAAVRARTKRELTQEDADKRDARRNREKLNDNAIVDADGKPLDSPADNPTDTVEPVEKEVSREDDPEAWIEAKITASEKRHKAIKVKILLLEEEVTELEAELKAAAQDQAKWERLKGAMNED